MDILTYRKQRSLSQADFACLLTGHGSPATQGLISQWELGALIPPDRAADIDRITGGDVQAEDLRPDLTWTRDTAGVVTGYHVPITRTQLTQKAEAA